MKLDCIVNYNYILIHTYCYNQSLFGERLIYLLGIRVARYKETGLRVVLTQFRICSKLPGLLIAV